MSLGRFLLISTMSRAINRYVLNGERNGKLGDCLFHFLGLKNSHGGADLIPMVRGGSGWLDSVGPFLSGAWRMADDAAVRRVVRWS